MTTAPSVDIRVRVLRLLNIMATVLPVRAPRRFFGIEPDLMARLWEWALRTRLVSSVGVRSAMDRRWRGAKGEVAGVEDVAYVCTCDRVKLRSAVGAGRNTIVLLLMGSSRSCRRMIDVQMRERVFR